MTSQVIQDSRRTAYSAYKPSGMVCVGEMLGHWERCRLQAKARYVGDIRNTASILNIDRKKSREDHE